jgi:hypothetical protein
MQAENLYNGVEIIGCKFSFWLPVAQGTLGFTGNEPATAAH